MDNMMFTANIVLPLFFLIAIGYLLKVFKVWGDDFLQPASRLSVRLFLPVLIFYNIYTSDFSSAFNPGLLMFAVVSVILLFLILMVLVPLFVKKNNQRGVVVQALFRSNLLILGVPICQELYGVEGAGIVAVICSFVVVLFNVLATVALSVFDDRNKFSVRPILKSIITNPMIIGSLMGLLLASTGTKLPVMVEKTVSPVSALATPFSLMVVGGSLDFSSLKSNIRIISAVTLLKLIIIPAIGITVSIAFGWRNELLAPMMVVFASPVATASYANAFHARADYQLAAQLIASTTLFSVATMFFIIFLGRSIGIL